MQENDGLIRGSLGVSAFLFLFYINSKHKLWIAPYLSMVFLLCSLYFIANKMNVFSTLKSMGGGGFNFPIIPAPHILILFAFTFFCASYLAFSLTTGSFRSNTVLVLFISIPSLAGALGRCDPGHVAFYGIGVFIVGLLYISNSHRWWKASKAAFILAFIVLASIGMLLLYGQSILRDSAYWLLQSRILPVSLVEKITEKHYGRSAAHQKIEVLLLQAEQNATSDPVLIPHQIQGTAETPFGYYVTYNPTHLDGGYYQGIANAFTLKAVQVKLDELAQHPTRELLLPGNYLDTCTINPNASRRLIRMLFIYPFNKDAVHTMDIYKPICDYISKNYSLIVPPQPDTYQYGIWARKSGTAYSPSPR